MNRLIMCVCAVVVCLPLTAFGAELANGTKCELSKPLQVSAKAKGKGKKQKLAKGSMLEIVNLTKGWSEVLYEGEARHAKTKQLEKLCVPQAAEEGTEEDAAGDAGAADEAAAGGEEGAADAAASAGDTMVEADAGGAGDAGAAGDAEGTGMAGDAGTAEGGDGAPATDEGTMEENEPMSEHGGGTSSLGGLWLHAFVGLHSTSQAVSSGGGGGVDIDESLAYELQGAYRYTESQSIGLSYFLDTYSMPSGTSMKFHGLMALWRYYFVFGQIEPFLEAGLGWVYLSTSAEAGGFSTSSSAKGVNIAGGLGAVYRLMPFLGVGAHARFSLPAFTSLCTDVNGTETCGTPNSNMKDIAYGVTVEFNPLAL